MKKPQYHLLLTFLLHSPQNSPIHHFEGSPNRRSLGIDLVQQQIYDYVESLEKKNASMKPEPSANP